jgi:transcriptional regulator with XRE-family HTH domain
MVDAYDPLERAAVERFGRDIADLCQARGLSQRGLAARCGVNQATISRLMRGRTPGMRLKTVARIVLALDGHVTGAPSSREMPHDD